MAFTLFSGICNLFPVLSLLSVRLMPAAIQIGACSGNFAALHVALVYSLLWLWKILHILLHYVCHVSVKRRCEVKGEKILEALYQRQKNTHKCNTMRDKSWIVTEIVMALLHANATCHRQTIAPRQIVAFPMQERIFTFSAICYSICIENEVAFVVLGRCYLWLFVCRIFDFDSFIYVCPANILSS